MFSKKKDREGTGEIALASREGREVQRYSGIFLNEMEIRGQKCNCGSESNLGLYRPIRFALTCFLFSIFAGDVLRCEG